MSPHPQVSCVFIYIRTYMHTCVCLEAAEIDKSLSPSRFLHTYICPCIYTHIPTYIHTCIHTHIHTYIHTGRYREDSCSVWHTQDHAHTHAHDTEIGIERILAYTHIYTYIHTCIYTNIHTYIQVDIERILALSIWHTGSCTQTRTRHRGRYR